MLVFINYLVSVYLTRADEQ